MLYVIVGCEIGFWVLLFGGLACRYLFGLRRVGGVLLVGVPLVDVVLLAASVIDLRNGAVADFGHGLAAAYIGFSVAFGHGIVARMDARFAYRFAGGPQPDKPAKYGAARTRREWREFGKAALAWAVACGLLQVAIMMVGDAHRTAALSDWITRLTGILGIWALVAVTYTIWPPRPRTGQRGPTR